MSGQKHLTPHLTLVFLRRGSTGEAEELVEDLWTIGEKNVFRTGKVSFLWREKR